MQISNLSGGEKARLAIVGETNLFGGDDVWQLGATECSQKYMVVD